VFVVFETIEEVNDWYVNSVEGMRKSFYRELDRVDGDVVELLRTARSFLIVDGLNNLGGVRHREYEELGVEKNDLPDNVHIGMLVDNYATRVREGATQGLLFA